MKKALFFILTILLLINCKQLENMNDRYEWLVETGADKGYPMEIISGSFIYENGEEAGIPGGMRLGLGSWWLSSNSGTIISGEQFRPIPVKMEIEWYSYAEDKFYTGSFQLDQQKLLEYFRKGYTHCVSGNNGNYSAFLIGLAPGGQVYLYLSGANRILVHQFKGQEVQVSNFKEVMRYNTDETREEIFKDFVSSMPKQTQQEIVEKRISTDIWDKLNKKYRWKLTWEMKDTPNYKLKLDHHGVSKYINAESMVCTSTDYFTEALPKPAPYEMFSDFESPAGRAFTLYTYFGYVNGVEPAKQDYETHRKREQEMVQLFEDFSEKIGGKEFELHIKFDENLKTAKAYLKYDKTEQEIPFVIFDFYE